MKNDTGISKTPRDLEGVMLVVGTKTWIAVASILVLLGATMIWAFFGTMYINRDVSGVLVRSGKVVTIYSPEDSLILDLSVVSGQNVEKNQVVARLDQSEIVDDINRMLSDGASHDDVSTARKNLLERSQVVSYDSGRVLDVYVRPGDYVEKGTRIATISVGASSAQSMECLLFLSMEKVRGVRKGMAVNVYPDFADTEKYGNMTGTVASVSEYPVTKQYLFDVLGNDNLVDAYLGSSACYEVRVDLARSEDTRTGYQWTISSGPQMDIGDLSLCDASIITDELRPIDVFFPRD